MKISNSLLCLDIQHDFVSCLVVERSSKASIVTGCGYVDYQDRNLEEAVSEVLSQAGYKEGPSIVTLGAEMFNYRNISVPFSDRKKIEQILPYELESRSAINVDQLIFEFNIGESGPEGTNVFVAMLQKVVLVHHIDTLQKINVAPERIGISGLALSNVLPLESNPKSVIVDFVDQWATLFLVKNGSVCLIRSIPAPPQGSITPDSLKSFLFNIDQTLLYFEDDSIKNSDLDLYFAGDTGHDDLVESLSEEFQDNKIHRLNCSDIPLVKIHASARTGYKPAIMDRLLACGIKGKWQGEDFNFRKYEFKTKKSIEYKLRLAAKLAVPALVLILIVSSYLVYGFSKLKEEQQSLDSQMKEIFTATLPEITRIVNPLHQMQIVKKDLQKSYRTGGKGTGSHSIVTILTELSARIPQQYQFRVVKMVVEKETIRVKAETGDFNIVDNIKKELAKSTLFNEVVISSANQSSKADKIICELKIYLAE